MAGVMALVSLNGCGGTVSQSGETGSGMASSEGMGNKTDSSGGGTLEPYTINWYMPSSGEPADIDKINAKATEMLKDLNITLNLNFIDWGSYEQKMQNSIASNEKVDLMWTSSWLANVYDYTRQGAFLDISDLAPKYAPDMAATLKGEFWDGTVLNGGHYAVPVNKEKSAQKGWLFNKKMIDEYGLDVSKVKSAEDITPLLEKIKAADPTLTPVEMTSGNSIPAQQWPIVNNYCVLLPNDDAYTLYIDNPEWQSLVKLMRQWYQAGYIKQDAVTNTDYTAEEKAGRIFMVETTLKPGKAEEYSGSIGVDFVQVPYTPTYISTADMFGSMNAIPASCENPERVLMFMNRLYSDKALVNLLVYGIEGTHYTKVSDNIIDFAAGTDDGAKSGYNPGDNWMVGDQFLDYLLKSEDPEKWDKFKAFNDEGVAVRDFGFVFDASAVKNELAACENVRAAYENAIQFGAVDPDTAIPEYRNKLMEAGVQKVIDETNRQYAEFKSSK